MSMFGGGFSGGIHQDVLSASPTDPEAIAGLVNEIKERSKGLIKIKNYPEAITLYTKAIELDDSNAILYANRSMCHFGMGTYEQAKSDGQMATTLDPSYAKGFYRLGISHLALKEYDEAESALMSGLAVLPDDKEMTSKLSQVRSERSQQKQQEAKKATPVSSSSSTTRSTQSSSKPPAASSTSSSASSSPSPSSSQVEAPESSTDDKDDDDDEEDLSNLRGYKKREDGRVTTFFNRDLDEKTKELIGSIAPKKLDTTAIPASAVPQAGCAVGTSVWNTAGTWEARDITPWAKQTIEELIGGVAYSIPAGGGTVRVSKVTSVTGDAEITSARGKRKHICDFTVELEWALETTVPQATEPFTGTMKVLDVNPDGDYDFQVTVSSSPSPAPSVSGLISKYVKSSSSGLQTSIVQALNLFCEQFKAM